MRPGLNGVGVPFSVTPSLTGVDKIVAVIVLHHITFISTWGITAPSLGVVVEWLSPKVLAPPCNLRYTFDPGQYNKVLSPWTSKPSDTDRRKTKSRSIFFPIADKALLSGTLGQPQFYSYSSLAPCPFCELLSILPDIPSLPHLASELLFLGFLRRDSK